PRCPGLPTLRAFPDAPRLARLDVGRLRRRTGLGPRAGPVRALARAVVSGRLDLERLELAGTEGLTRTLPGIRGLDPAGIAWLRLLLGHFDAPGRRRAWRGAALWFASWLETPDARRLAEGARPIRRPRREVRGPRAARTRDRETPRPRQREPRTRPPRRG